uniref:Dockerin domain-containing protein n=1 Tax=Candidatus Methanogaster sp. ANME-2c ERB4 TaxID=2759911 RepID=A0A7G9YKZ2_9EURY|nr:hypothetical protein AMAKCJMG_00010 [Methanosarcinales archaeon ANME-2c ERB4]
MNVNKLRNISTALIIATMLIGMLPGVMADPDNAPNVPALSTGMGISEERGLGQTDPNASMAYRVVDDHYVPLVLALDATLPECSFTHGITVGDFNGDGMDDVILFNGTYNSITYTYTFEHVSAVNGCNGTELWDQRIVYNAGALDNTPARLAGDLDCDGMDDVIVNSRSYDPVAGECTASVHVRRGYDGDLFWNQSVTSNGTYSAGMWAYPCCDLNYDGMDDVIVILESYDSAADEYTAGVRVIRGYDGEEFWNQSVTGDGWYGAYIWAYPYDDLDYDNSSAIIVNSQSYDSATGEKTATSHVKRGYDGAELWNQSVAGTDVSIWAYPCEDLDCDNRSDVIVDLQSYDSAADNKTVRISAIRGYNGAELWNQSVAGDGPDGAGMWVELRTNLDSDNTSDAIVNLQSYDSAADEYTVGVHAIRGYDGEEFWNKSVTGDGWGGAYIWAYPHDDLDSDNLDDVIVNFRSYNSATDKNTASVHAIHGCGGDALWNRSVTGDGWAGADMWVHPCGDLNSDGGRDVIIESVSYDAVADKYTANADAIRGYDGDEFWNKSVTGDGECGAYIMWVESDHDLDSDGKDDAIVNSWSCNSATGEKTAGMCAIRGYDGDEFWNKSVTGIDVAMWAYSYQDLDGDNNDDAIVHSQSYDPAADEYTASVHAVRGYDGAEFWNKRVTGKDVWMETDYRNPCHYHSNQDFDCDNLEDMLLSAGISVDDAYIPTTVCAVKGDCGTSLWCNSASPGTEHPVAPSVTGDLNYDGKLTPADAIIVLDSIVSGDCNEYADVNNDGAVNSLDTLMILQAAAGSIAI